MGTLDQLQELDLIKDPVLKAKRKAEIIQSMLGKTYARTAVSPIQLAKPSTASVEPKAVGPTVKHDAGMNYLRQQIDQAEHLNEIKGKPAAAYTDDELGAIMNDPNKDLKDPNNMTGQEIEARKQIDAQSLPRKMVNPTYLNRLSRNVVASAGEMVSSGPLAMAGTLTNIPKYFGNESITSGDEMLKAANYTSNKIRSKVGITQPRDIGESAAGILPQLTPLGLKNPETFLGSMLEYASPFMVGSGPKRAIVNFAVGMGAEQGLREIGDAAGDPYKTATDQLGITGGAGDVAYPAIQNILGTGLATMGVAGVAAPIIARGAMRQYVAKHPVMPIQVRDIDIHGPENLTTLELSKDLGKTYVVDAKEPLTDLMRRAGVPNIDEVAARIDGETGMTAVVRANYAMKTGRLESKNGSFHIDMTPDQLTKERDLLPPQMQVDVDQYLKYHYMRDILQKRIANPKNPSMDADIDKLVNVKQNIRDIRERNPLADQFLTEYGRITGAVRDFLASGPNAMIGSKRKLELETTQSHHMPVDIIKVDPAGNPIQRMVDSTAPMDQRSIDSYYRQNPTELVDNMNLWANSFDMLNDYTRNALKAKMQNDATGAYITAMKNSPLGKDTIRLATKKELKNPIFKSRLLSVWEEGKRKTYISSQLQATLARFDPYIAKYPNLFMSKRLFEYGSTGPGSLTFAPMTMMRDTVGGWITKEPGMLAANPFEVVGAVAEPIIAKTKMAIVQMLEQGTADIPFIGNRQAFIDQVGTSLTNSMYELSMMNGGTDASLMRHSMQVAKSTIRQISAEQLAAIPTPIKTLGYSMRGLLKGWETLFDAISEAPRTATFKKNVKAGMDPAEAATRSRRITGDTTRSGQVYDKYGKRIDADAQDKGGKAGLNLAGPATEFIRETVPWINPMVQGLRRYGNRLLDNPIETNLRAWTAVGIPTIAAMGWNEMLGPEYNQYAFEQRTSNQIAMYPISIGIPGIHPRYSMQLPIPHEFTLHGSPYSTAIYSLMRGDEAEDMKAMVMHQAGASLSNAAAIGLPQFLSTTIAGMGMKPPSGWKDEIYTISEDNVGALPQNAETILRTVFGSITDVVGMSAASFSKGGPEDFFKELGYQLGKRTPIVKNLIGATGPVSQFTPDSEIAYKETNAVDVFTKIWDEHFGAGGGEFISAPNRKPPPLQGAEYTDSDITSQARMGPIASPIPTNPVFQMYGDVIKEQLDNNDEGYSALKYRMNLYKEQIKNLRQYTAGSKSGFRAWRKSIQGTDDQYQAAMKEFKAEYPEPYLTPAGKESYGTAGNQKFKQINGELGEKAKLDRLIRDNKLDMGKRSDVQWLVGELEKERIEIRKAQRVLIKNVENMITTDMQMKGMLPNGVRFDVTKHLGVNPPADLIQLGLPPQAPN